MRLLKMLVLSGVAALLMCLAMAGSALATLGPLWGYCDTVTGGLLNAHCESGGGQTGYEALLLQSGQSLLVLGLSLNEQLLKSTTAADSILCGALHGHGYLNGGDPGTDVETLVYTGCTVPGAPHCDVLSEGAASGTIATTLLESKLVYLTEAGAKTLNAAETGTLFRPKSGTTFTELLLTALSGSCPITTPPVAKVEGEVITENEKATERALLHTLIAPTTAKTEYWLDTSPSPTKDTITRINLGGVNATYLGKVSVDVSLLGHFGEWLAYWVCP
jgi:hypothetical protein